MNSLKEVREYLLSFGIGSFITPVGLLVRKSEYQIDIFECLVCDWYLDTMIIISGSKK